MGKRPGPRRASLQELGATFGRESRDAGRSKGGSVRGRRVNDSAPENSEPKGHRLSHRRDRCSRQKLLNTHFAQES